MAPGFLALTPDEVGQIVEVAIGLVFVGFLLVAANLGERSQGWRVTAYAMLLFPAGLLTLLSLANVLSAALVGSTSGGVSVPRQVAGGLLLFVAAMMVILCVLPPVRRAVARVLPGFRDDSPLHAVSLSLYFATLLAFISLQISTDQLKAITQSGESPSVLFIIATNQLPFLVVAVIGVGFLTRRTLGQTAQRLGLYWPGFRWLIASVGVAVLLVGCGTLFDILMTKLTPQQSHDIQQVSDQLLRNVNGYGAAIALALAAGIGEEILFRGALLPRLGNPLSALLFATLHAQYAISLATLEIFILGLVLGWLRRRAGTTGAIIAHSGYDMILLVFAVLAGH